MRPSHRSIFFLLFAMVIASPVAVFAEGRAGTVKSNARVRSAPSTNTQILGVLKKGTPLTIMEEKNGWYRISHNNTSGWMAGWLVTPAAQPTEKSPGAGSVTLAGVYNAPARLRSGPSLTASVVRVFPKGEPVTIIESGNGWHHVMHASGAKGWSADWLVDLASQPSLPQPPSLPTEDTQPSRTLRLSRFQGGTVPSGVDVIALNQYWLEKVNALRREKNLRELVLDQRWIDTASEYAAYMGPNRLMNHARPDGKTMHQWIDAKQLPFTKRYSPGGWRGNYFTENLSGGTASGTTESVKQVLDRAMQSYLAEASSNGAHYRTTYHEDWNSVGVGFYFEDAGNGRYRVSCVFHYGSLVLSE